MTTEMKIKAIAPWFGSKRTLAPLIVEELGPHSSYFEPFCGSLSVVFAKEPTTQETGSDLHPDIINLARVLASYEAPKLYLRLSRVLYSEDLYQRSRSVIANSKFRMFDDCDINVERAYHYFILSWISRNGTAGTDRYKWQMAVRYTPRGGQGPLRFRNSVESIPAWHERLRNVSLLCRDGFGLIEKIDDTPKTALYVDPPYLLSTRGGGGGSLYQHDFDEFSEPNLFGDVDDHQRLAELLGRFKQARVVVSYYDHPRLQKLYPAPQWTIRKCYRQKNLHVQNRRGMGKLEAPEVLIINGPSYGEGKIPSPGFL